MNPSKPLIDVLTGETPERRPVWLMRQAGRYLPEYRELRQKAGSFLDLCYAPEWAAEVTLQPLRRFDLDAAILFSDILVVPHAMGLHLSFVENEGPKLQTVSGAEHVAALKTVGPFWQFDKVSETVARVSKGLGAGKALIGFCGAPWTVASYMIEGGSSDRARARAIAVENPGWYSDMVEKIIDVSVIYLKQQIEAGAEAIQIFDSWAGDLPAGLLDRCVIEPIRRIVDGVRSEHRAFPVIVFARGVGDSHSRVARGTGANAVSVEQGLSLAEVARTLPENVALQGNLDPGLLVQPRPVMIDAALKILSDVPMDRHIFNLGHGIMPQTEPEAVQALVNTIRTFDGGNA
jgi:uroporphyrinogen decarboxylase